MMRKRLDTLTLNLVNKTSEYPILGFIIVVILVIGYPITALFDLLIKPTYYMIKYGRRPSKLKCSEFVSLLTGEKNPNDIRHRYYNYNLQSTRFGHYEKERFEVTIAFETDLEFKEHQLWCLENVKYLHQFCWHIQYHHSGKGPTAITWMFADADDAIQFKLRFI